jgi:uncharacterized protein (TIGR02646 family)
MIRIYRSAEVPESLQPKRIKPYYGKMEAFFKQPAEKRAQQRFEFDISPIRAAREQLAKEFNYKCAYCENKIDEPIHSDLESFRCKGGSKDFDGFYPDHYWWLYYEWRNCFYCCQTCNRYKVNWFPVEGVRAAIGASYEDALKEKNLLIDPTNDDPSLSLRFNEDGTVSALDKKGEVTINILKLDRKELVQLRGSAIQSLSLALDGLLFTIGQSKKSAVKVAPKDIGDWLKSIFKDNSEEKFAAALRDFTKKWFQQQAKLQADITSFLGFDMQNLWQQNMEAGAAPPETGTSEKPAIKKAVAKKASRNPSSGQSVRSATSGNFAPKSGSAPAKFSSARSIKTIKKAAKKAAAKAKPALVTSKAQAFNTLEDFDNFISEIRVSNFKMIEKLTLPFSIPEETPTQMPSANIAKILREPWLMLLGENGVGKSSFLQAVTLALAGGDYVKKLGIKPADILRHGQEKGFVEVYYHGVSSPVSIHFSRAAKAPMSSHPHPTEFLIAYGSTRLFASKKLTAEESNGKVKAMNLFSAETALADAQQWIKELFVQAKKSQQKKLLFDRVALAIKDLLLFHKDEEITVEDNYVVFKYRDKSHDRLVELSDGYKSVVALVVDLMKTLVQADLPMESATGIVVLDEIGTHLHPRWRMQVVQRFRNVFPRMQFIVTTHDPLCLRGLKKGEVAVFKKDNKGKVVAISDLPDPSGYRSDQLLSSDFFGLKSTIDPEVEEAFNELNYLKSRKTLKETQQKRMEELELWLADKQHLGNSKQEELTLKRINKMLDETKVMNEQDASANLKEPTVSLLKNLFK